MTKRFKYTKFAFDSEESATPLFDNQYRQSLIETYRAVWRQDPYNEHFSVDEVETALVDYFYKFSNRGFLAVDLRSDKIIGFAYGYTLTPEVSQSKKWRKRKLRQRTHGQNKLEEFFDGRTFYFEEFGVHPKNQKGGIGAELYQRLEGELAADSEVDRIALITTKGNWVIEKFYDPREFEWSGITIPIRQERTDGTIKTDVREWLIKEL